MFEFLTKETFWIVMLAITFNVIWAYRKGQQFHIEESHRMTWGVANGVITKTEIAFSIGFTILMFLVWGIGVIGSPPVLPFFFAIIFLMIISYAVSFTWRHRLITILEERGLPLTHAERTLQEYNNDN